MPVKITKKIVHREPPDASRIGSVRTFLDELEKLERKNDIVLFFRGHSNFSYELKPSIYRNIGWIKNEDVLFKELILRCPGDFASSDSTFQTLVKMQHYSLPTRLLDITTNPLIALYFACSPGRLPYESGEVVVFRIPKQDLKYFDSDTVSVIANISRRPVRFRVTSASKTLRSFNKHREIQLLLHEIKKEKPYFEPHIDPRHIESVVCVKPKLDNARIIRQDGAFLLFGISGNKLSPAAVPSSYLPTAHRMLVVASEKSTILAQLEALGITQGTIYPEIEKVAEHIRKVYLSYVH